MMILFTILENLTNYLCGKCTGFEYFFGRSVSIKDGLRMQSVIFIIEINLNILIFCMIYINQLILVFQDKF